MSSPRMPSADGSRLRVPARERLRDLLDLRQGESDLPRRLPRSSSESDVPVAGALDFGVLRLMDKKFIVRLESVCGEGGAVAMRAGGVGLLSWRLSLVRWVARG